MKFGILLVFAFSNSLFSQSISEFKYNEIPFGKTEEEVLAMVKGSTIDNDANVSVFDFYGCRAIKKHFENCVFTFLGNGGYFLTDFTKKYTIKYSGWENIESIDLYFTKTFDKDDPYTLFLVHKKMNSEDGNLQTIGNNYSISVSKILGKQPIVSNSINDLSSGYTANSKLLFWDLPTAKLFVMVIDLAFARNAEFIYVSKSELNKYKQSVIQYQKQKKLEQQNNSNSNAKDF